MDIFVGNLPADGTLIELQELIGEFDLHGRFERRLGKDKNNREYHYFLVRTDTEEEGRELIRHLDGALYKDHRLTARQFVWRRELQSGWKGLERRINKGS